ncbi:MAG TPA: ribonuclease H family protein, partial [Pseudoneobacillus sp.]|nr:ribonuclease H family protein [Pseudoneobacillus sp.]
MAGKKYYVVWNGRKTGIFETWAECEEQTKGFQGARFKSFSSLEEATTALKGGPSKKTTSYQAKQSPTNKTKPSPTSFEIDSISVDAACSGNPGMMEYRGVYTKTGETLFHYGPVLGTN